MAQVVVSTVLGPKLYNRVLRDSGRTDLTVAFFTLNPKGLAENMTAIAPSLRDLPTKFSKIHLVSCNANNLGLCFAAGQTPIKVFRGAEQLTAVHPGPQIMTDEISSLVGQYAAWYFPAPEPVQQEPAAEAQFPAPAP